MMIKRKPKKSTKRTTPNNMIQEHTQNMQQCITQRGKKSPTRETTCLAPCLAKRLAILLAEQGNQKKEQPKLQVKSRV